MMRGLAADAAEAERAADGELEIVREDRWGQALRVGGPKEIGPLHAGTDRDAVSLDLADRGQRVARARLDDDPARYLRLSVGRVPLTANRDLELVLSGIADHLRDVLHGARLEHRHGSAVNDVSEVVARIRDRRAIGAERAVQARHPVASEACRRIADPGTTRRVESKNKSASQNTAKNVPPRYGHFHLQWGLSIAG